MKFHGSLTIFTALIGLAHALPAAIPAEELTTEDIIELSKGYLASNFKGRKRDGCNSDNALRLLRDKRYSVSASAFCSKFIQSTITDIVLVPATVTTETTKTPPPTSVTVTEISVLTETDTSTSISFIPTTVVPIPNIVKRSQIAYPSWLSTQYSPSRVSSACSCFITAPLTPTHVTNTIVTGTTTAFSKTITLPPVISTITESVTTITTVTSIVATSKIINCKVTPACRDGSAQPLGDLMFGYTYAQCKTKCLETEGCLSSQSGVVGTAVEGVCLLSASTVENTYGDISRVSSVCTWWYMDDVECIYLD
ncbi:hypothetical protein TWF506_009863 [Arthrobotrys conoides]|uniref:Apple domain-containing protein n=1 Tax=Arthrobotrys conoides TaxID=74498 RepID=A0AAN8NJS6_9PEZI